MDENDANRAATIVAALGAVDVGQGAVVQQGLCLAVETLSGTDAMLASLGSVAALRPDAGKGRGLFYKAPKPGQDKRIDLPTIGPNTLRAVVKGGLGGIVWQAGGVICLDLPEMQTFAADHGLFLWARP
jgi:UDP-2,3-diacylglucosamine hydrolase